MVEEDGGFFAAIDPTVTLESKRDGLARELVSRVQRMRKESEFAVSDQIRIRVAGDDVVRQDIKTHGGWISEEVLASELGFASDAERSWPDVHAIDLDGTTALVAITRIE